MATIVTRPEDLTNGKWYALGFTPVDGGKIEWNDRPGYGATILKFEGNGTWTDEDGEVVETIFDDETGVETTPNEADEFVLQS